VHIQTFILALPIKYDRWHCGNEARETATMIPNHFSQWSCISTYNYLPRGETERESRLEEPPQIQVKCCQKDRCVSDRFGHSIHVSERIYEGEIVQTGSRQILIPQHVRWERSP